MHCWMVDGCFYFWCQGRGCFHDHAVAAADLQVISSVFSRFSCLAFYIDYWSVDAAAAVVAVDDDDVAVDDIADAVVAENLHGHH